MPGEVRGVKRGAEWTKVTGRAVRCGWLDQAARESMQVLVVPVGSGRERLVDVEPLINLHVGGAGDCFTRIGLGLLEKDQEGVFW